MTEEAMMPRYKCHKEVYALKIKDIKSFGFYAHLVPVEAGYSDIYVDHDYLSKHQPQVGGYYVIYNDGYKSFSPEKAFEEGYTRI